MATYWWKKKVGVSTGSGTFADPWNGAKVLDGKNNDGTVNNGDTVEFHHGDGAVTLASDGADWACTASISTRLLPGDSQGTTSTSATRYTNVRGILFGTSMGPESTASGITFSFNNVTGSGFAIDMRGATSTTQRMFAALRIKGEDIVVTGLKVNPPDWAYICDHSVDPPITRIAPISGLQAEQVSHENGALWVYGNGNTIENCEVDGSDGWCRYGIMMYVSAEGVPTASANKVGYVRNNTFRGCLTHFEIQAYGTGTNGYHLEKPTYVHAYGNTSVNFCWGRSALHLPTTTGNAASHGNGIGVQGRFFGGCFVYQNVITGDVQDAIAVGSSAGTMVYKNYIYDIGQPTYTEWYANGTVWDTRVVTNTGDAGNGIKLGLTNRDGTSPSTWLGTDGTANTTTASLQVAELRNVCAHNVIHNTNGSGVTLNNGRGALIHGNQITDPRGAGLLLSMAPDTTKRGQVMVTHNYVKKTDGDGTNGSSNFACNIQSGVHVSLYNNIFWSNPAISAHEDLRWAGATLIGKDKNVMVTNRAVGTGYNTTGDMNATARTDAQTYTNVTVATGPVTFTGGGFSSGSLLNAGSDRIASTRTFRCSKNLVDAVLDSTPNVGPV
jgi:hypothetical protein